MKSIATRPKCSGHREIGPWKGRRRLPDQPLGQRRLETTTNVPPHDSRAPMKSTDPWQHTLQSSRDRCHHQSALEWKHQQMSRLEQNSNAPSPLEMTRNQLQKTSCPLRRGQKIQGPQDQTLANHDGHQTALGPETQIELVSKRSRTHGPMHQDPGWIR